MQSWKVPAAAIVGRLLMPLSACAPGGGSSAATGETPSKDLGSEKVNLRVVTIRGSGAPRDKIITAFEKTHPSIAVTNEKLLLRLHPHKVFYEWDTVSSPGALGDCSIQENLTGSGRSELAIRHAIARSS